MRRTWQPVSIWCCLFARRRLLSLATFNACAALSFLLGSLCPSGGQHRRHRPVEFLMVDQPLPTGTVTFLFTDIEGSTRLWEVHGDAMARAVAGHDAILHEAIAAQGGQV